MKISKRQLRRIIKEEKAKITAEMMEQEGAMDPNQHHYPSADNAINDVVEELKNSWHEMELKAWSAGDPSMNKQGELSDAESKEYWGEQVDAATEELDSVLGDRLRAEALKVMQEFTDSLINGDYA